MFALNMKREREKTALAVVEREREEWKGRNQRSQGWNECAAVLRAAGAKE